MIPTTGARLSPGRNVPASSRGTGTSAFRRELLATQSYDDSAESAEESFFLNKFTVPMVQLDPARTILCMEHGSNTFDKMKLIQEGESAHMRPVTSANQSLRPRISEQRLQQYAEVFRQRQSESAD